jgi:hypothetical protein
MKRLSDVRMFYQGTTCAALFLLASNLHAVTYQPLSVAEDPLIWGVQGNAHSTACALSGNGLATAFTSSATQLVLNDNNGFSDAFLRVGSALRRIGLRASGAEPLGRATRVAISDTGRYIAVLTDEDLLETQGGPNFTFNLSAYWIDLQTNTIRLASKTLTGTRATIGRTQIDISGNGRYVVFDSEDSQITAGDSNNETDIFRYDATADTVALVSSNAAGVIANSYSTAARIDDSGDWVVFESEADNLIPAAVGIGDQVYVKQLSTGMILRVSQSTAGAASSRASRAHIAGAGGFVVFETPSRLVATDTDNFDDIYRHNLSTRATERVSVSAFSGNAPNADSNNATISANGRYVWFDSDVTNFNPPPPAVAGAPFAVGQIYRRDMSSNTILQATNGSASAFDARSSDDGQVVCFMTQANLLPSDRNEFFDVYRYSAALGTTEQVSIANSILPSPYSAYGSVHAVPTLNAARVLIRSDAAELDRDNFQPGDLEGRLLSIAPTSGQITAIDPPSIGATSVEVTPDGQWAAVDLESNASANDLNFRTDSYRLNLATGAYTLLSAATTGSAAGTDSTISSRINGTGNRVVFLSSASNLVANDTNARTDAFLWQSGTPIRRMNLSTAGVQANESVLDVDMDASGNSIVFQSVASNLVNGDTNGESDIFVHDLTQLTTTRVSVGSGGSQLTEGSFEPTISPDGRYVAYYQNTTVPTGGFYIYDRTTQTTERMALPAGMSPYGESLRFSQSPRYLSYIALNPQNVQIAYRYDRMAAEPNFELWRTSPPAANRTPFIYSVRMATLLQALIATDEPIAPGDNNNRSDIVFATLQAGELSFTGSTLVVAESAGTIDIPIQRLLGTDGMVSTGSNFIAVSANLSDYTIVQPNATWVSGDSTQQVLRLSIIDDVQVEGNETLRVQLTAIDGGASSAMPGQVTITIIDNDSPLIFANGFE